ncbi:MAG: hypothetical protein K2M46_07605, partial [Lachnospiraceae bacterium]|nr:hypothetical protein [Lachnospiraceae bacterium]
VCLSVCLSVCQLSTIPAFPVNLLPQKIPIFIVADFSWKTRHLAGTSIFWQERQSDFENWGLTGLENVFFCAIIILDFYTKLR